MFVPQRGGTLATFMFIGWTVEIFMCYLVYPWATFLYCLHAFTPYWNFEYTKAVTLHCAKVGGVWAKVLQPGDPR